MYYVFALGALSVLAIVLQPLKHVLKKRKGFAQFGNKTIASMLFLMAGTVAAGMRETMNWQVAALLFGMCLAVIGDCLLAIGPALDEKKHEDFIFPMGGVSIAAAHVLTFVALLSFVDFEGFDWRTLGIAAFLPIIYVALWLRRKLIFGKHGVPIVFYALILGGILWAAMLSNNFLAVVVALLYMFGNTALFFSKFGKKSFSRHKMTWLVLLPYYMAQAVLAYVMMII